MSVTVGEVLTFFEGKAEGLFKTIDKIEKALDDLSRKSYKLEVKLPQDIFPTKEILKGLKEVEQKLDKFADSINSLASRVLNSAKGLSAQIEDYADSTISRIQKDAESAIEKWYARQVVSIASVFVLISKKFETVIDTIAFEGLGLLASLKLISSPILEYLTSQLHQAHSTLVGISGIVKYIQFSLAGGGILGSIAGIVSRVSLFGSTLLIYKTFLKESYILGRRLLGIGTSALSPMERASRLISTIDTSVANIGIKTGPILKTIGFGIATFYGPFSGLIAGIPFLNSFIDNAIAIGLKLRLKFFTFFGSARSQFQLIVFQLKEALQTASGFFSGIAQGQKDMRANAGAAEKQLKKLGTSSKELQAVGRAKLPLATQFQIAFTEAKGYMAEFTKKINVVVLTLQTAFGMTREQVKDISSKANNATLKAKQEIQKTGETIQKLSTIGPWGRLANRIKGVFSSIYQGIYKYMDAPGYIDKNKSQQQTQVVDKAKLEKTWNISTKISSTFAFIKNTTLAISMILAKIGSSPLRYILRTASDIRNEMNLMQPTLEFSREEFSKLAKNAMLLEKGKSAKGKVFPSKGSGSAKGFFSSIDQFLQGKGDILNVIELLRKQEIVIASLAKAAGNAGKPIGKLFEQLGIGKNIIIPDLSRLTDQFKEMKRISGLTGSKFGRGGFAKGGSIADDAIVQIKKGLQQGMQEINPLLGQYINVMAEFFPPDAKRGAFSKLKLTGKAIITIITGQMKIGISKFYNSGKLIVGYLANGIKSAFGKAKDATAYVAEIIANYFPRSLPGIGALVTIVKAGALIPFYLAKGILQGAKFAKNAAASVAKLIISPFSIGMEIGQYVYQTVSKLVTTIQSYTGKAAELGHLSERLGVSVEQVSALDYVMKTTVGGSAQDLSYVLGQIGRTLSGTFSAEQQQKVAELGINLRNVKNAGNPTLAFLLEMSDAIQGLEPGTKKFNDAIELLGVTADSKLINVLKLGREEIKNLAKEGVQAGNVISKSLAKSSVAFSQIVNKFTVMKERYLDNFLDVIMPDLVAAGQKILEIITKNKTKIQALLTIVGKGLKIVTSGAIAFVKIAFENPGKALDIIKGTFKVIISFVWNTIAGFYSNIKTQLGNFLKDLGVMALDLVLTILEKIFDGMKNLGEKMLPKVFTAMANSVSEGIKKLGEMVSDRPTAKQVERQAAQYGMLGAGDTMFPEEAYMSEEKLQKQAQKKRLDSLKKYLDEITNKASEDWKKLKKSGKELASSVIDPQQIEMLKNETKKALDGLGEVVKGTDLEKQLNELIDLFSKKSTDEVVEKIKEFKRKTKKEIDKIDAPALQQTSRLGDQEKFTRPETMKAFLDQNSSSWGKINELISGTKSEAEKITEEYQNQIKELDEFIRKVEQSKLLDEEAKRALIEPAEEAKYAAVLAKTRKYNAPIISGLGEAFSQSLNTLATKGKLTFEDLSTFAANAFQKSFDSVLQNLQQGFEKLVTQGLEALGASSEMVAGVINGIFAIGMLLMQRLKTSVEVTHNAIQDNVEEMQEKIRGVVVGDVNVSLANVVEKFSTAQVPVTLRLDKMIILLTQIRDQLGGSATVSTTAESSFSSLGLVESY